jgi:hypothetical protein
MWIEEICINEEYFDQKRKEQYFKSLKAGSDIENEQVMKYLTNEHQV